MTGILKSLLFPDVVWNLLGDSKQVILPNRRIYFVSNFFWPKKYTSSLLVEASHRRLFDDRHFQVTTISRHSTFVVVSFSECYFFGLQLVASQLQKTCVWILECEKDQGKIHCHTNICFTISSFSLVWFRASQLLSTNYHLRLCKRGVFFDGIECTIQFWVFTHLL